ncbi:MAG: SH3 domain-containing protein [Clostridium sp.]|nr:SH3 domain-containing protein [Clostridium sp.]
MKKGFLRNLNIFVITLLLGVTSMFLYSKDVKAASTNESTTYSVNENMISGGQAYAVVTAQTWTSPSMTTKAGLVYAGEGVTYLYDASNNTAFIEYSTSSGPKQAYIPKDYLNVDTMTGVARVVNNASLRYGPYDSGSAEAGTVYAGEYVTVLCKSNDWVYIEYNTNSGRKRGYLSDGYLKRFKSNTFNYHDVYEFTYFPTDSWADGRIYVYSGPGKSYIQIGYVENEVFKAFDNSYYNGWVYISYSISGGLGKSGWIYVGEY